MGKSILDEEANSERGEIGIEGSLRNERSLYNFSPASFSPVRFSKSLLHKYYLKENLMCVLTSYDNLIEIGIRVSIMILLCLPGKLTKIATIVWKVLNLYLAELILRFSPFQPILNVV